MTAEPRCLFAMNLKRDTARQHCFAPTQQRASRLALSTSQVHIVNILRRALRADLA